MKPFAKISLFLFLALGSASAICQTLPVLPAPDYSSNHDAQINGTVTIGGTQNLPGILARLTRVVPGGDNIIVSYAISDANGNFTLTGRSGVNYVVDYEFPTSGFTTLTAIPSTEFTAAAGANTVPEGGLTLTRKTNTITNCNVSVSTLTPFTNQSVTVDKAVPINPSATLSSVQIFTSSLVSNPTILVSTTTTTEVQKLIIGASVKISNPFTTGTLSNLVTTKSFANDEDPNPDNQNPIEIPTGSSLSYFDITSGKTNTTNIAAFNPNYIGTGTITFPISGTASKTITNSGGNTSSQEVTSALGGVCLIYTYSIDPLPVTLASFSAKVQTLENNKNVVLNWKTTQEVNSEYFDVQHSTDAKQWNTLGKVLASYESSESKNYEFIDSAPKSNTNYYRLKMVDRDGTYAYSRIETASLDGNDLAVTVYPNPVSSEIFVKDISAETVKELSIINSNGQLVHMSKSISSTEGINVKGLANGLYIVKVLRTDGTQNANKILIRH
ncbi:T9SS type A sorting domain-containing protein [Dyadobacter sp. CY356]|uniref:T9SS type A sorting domain-containing protein n=1 Tax=Dyadobacter sp. CY356 TaxID=2906442 RepID=UPI001F407A64|nr:T9SS type A sorting domain-containing protein [Dyadobacter sp. CY356]MCF0056671.1 T9SS type A sorting domain-containing protein [Dyadobacter sp. CY356]